MNEPREQITKFFIVLDGIIDQEIELTVIGGTAMVLGFSSQRMTTDCDPWGKTEEELLNNWKQAIKESGIKLSIDTQAAVAQMPYCFEDRLEK